MIYIILKVIFYLFLIQVLLSFIKMFISFKIKNKSKKDDSIIDVEYEEVE